MPRFFFNLRDDVSVEDGEGKELPDAASARAEAVRHARDIMSEDIKEGRLMLNDSIDIVDEQGRPVATLRFREAIEFDE